MRRAQLSISALAIAAALASCKSESPEIQAVGSSTSRDSCESAALVGPEGETVPVERRHRVPAGERISFTQHVEPMLSSQADGFVYKCTVCHANYARAEEVQRSLDDILSSIKARRMPTGGDPVRDFDVELLERWRSESAFALDGPPATNVLPLDVVTAPVSTSTDSSTASSATTSSETSSATATATKNSPRSEGKPCKSNP